MGNVIDKICEVLYRPDWNHYQDYRKDDKGWPIDWSEAEKKLKTETAKKILKVIEEDKNENCV